MLTKSWCQIVYSCLELFEIEEDSFMDKYRMAISGDGQEYRRILTLHSSSLAALLCFYSVSPNNPLIITINESPIVFTESFFEVKNKVKLNTNHDSNIDIVLRGKNSKNKNVTLFLESKFSEYLDRNNYTKISKEVYNDFYKGLAECSEFIEKFTIDFSLENSIAIKTNDNYCHYASGIKQMISHYMGVNNFVKGTSAKSHKGDLSFHKDEIVYLGEIVFRFDNDCKIRGTNKTKFEDYDECYSLLAKTLNNQFSNNFMVIDKLMTFQNVFKDFNLNPKIKEFYNL